MMIPVEIKGVTSQIVRLGFCNDLDQTRNFVTL